MQGVLGVPDISKLHLVKVTLESDSSQGGASPMKALLTSALLVRCWAGPSTGT